VPLQQFFHQVERLVALRYPDLLGMDTSAFRAALEPLAQYVPEEAPPTPEVECGKASFVLIINSPLAPVRATLQLIERRGKTAVERLSPIEPERFTPIEAIELPAGNAYLMHDIDRGKDTLNVAPDAALESIDVLGRSPLTIEEGVALLTHFPEFLQPNNCFSLLASRCGDKRVPALWLSEGRPKLGWCWAGNPHTWLGSASCAKRSSAVELPVAAYAK
jgi:hypothetical protein